MNTRSPRGAAAAVLAGAAFVAFSAAPAFAASRIDRPVSGHIDELIQNHTYGTPSFLRGHLSVRTTASDPVSVARAFLNAERSVLGIRNPDQELRVLSHIDRDSLGMSHVKFAQFHRGLPVFGSELVVHLRGTEITSLNGVFLPSLDLPVEVRVEADDAADLAIDHLRDLINRGEADGLAAGRANGLDLDSNPVLGFYNEGLVTDQKAPSRLAWQMSINGYLFYVSAETGRVLDAYENIHTAMNRSMYTAKNGTTLPGTLVCSEGQTCSTSDTDVQNAWGEFADVYNYWKNTHGRDSWDGKGSEIIGSAHYSSNFQNAYWDGSQMVFGDGFVVNDVTAHELGHAVCQTTANLTYKSQSGALNESFSDVWGAMVDRDDWLIGEDLSIGAVRDMSDPNAYNQPKDMTEYKRMFFRDNGGVHINSGIPNYAAYLLSDGGSNQGVTVVGQGRDVTEKIWYRTESTKLTASSKFADFAKLAVAACGEIYGASSQQCVQTTNAMKATKMM